MKTKKDIKKIVLDLIEQFPHRVEKNHLVTLVVADITIPECEDKDLLTMFMFDDVAQIVSAVIRDVKRKFKKEDAQLILLGFKHIQERYSIKINGEWIVIPTSEITIAQLYQKRAELVKDRDGTQEHIDEIDELIKIMMIINLDDDDVA